MKIRRNVSRGLRKRRSVSATSLASAGVFAQGRPAYTASPERQRQKRIEDTIVVTGTSIKGPGADRIESRIRRRADELEKTAATNLSTLVNTIPALTHQRFARAG